MALEVTCAGCGKRYRVAEGMAGKRLKCSACEGVVAVTARQGTDVDLGALAELASMEEQAKGLKVPVYVAPKREGGGSRRLVRVLLAMAAVVWVTALAMPYVMPYVRMMSLPSLPFISAKKDTFQGFRMAGATGAPGDGRVEGTAVEEPPVAEVDQFRDENGELTHEPAKRYTDGSISYTWVFNPDEEWEKQHQLELYLPPPEFKRPVPCVFLTGAGATPCTGTLQNDRLQARVDYALLRKGFAVCDYDTSGRESDEKQAMADFMAANGGLADARRAMDFVSKASPAVDQDRFYAAGAGAAANLALRLLAEEPRVKGAIAIMPWADYEHVYANTFKVMQRGNAAAAAFVQATSPMQIDPHHFHGPLYMVAASPGYGEERAYTQQLAARARDAGAEVKFSAAANGDLQNLDFLDAAAQFGADFLLGRPGEGR